MKASIPIAVALLSLAAAWAEASGSGGNTRPAAREHVRVLDGQAFRFTSRLKRVVELNFTYGETHEMGKLAISAALLRIAASYGRDGKPAFEVRSLAGRNGGAAVFDVPGFGLEDLLAGEVLVANNLGYITHDSLGTRRRKAIRDAVDSAGRGWLSFHGSAAHVSKAWRWYADTLEPRRFQGHSQRVPLPVYRDRRNGRHLILQDILGANTVFAEVPDGYDVNGAVVLAPNVATRLMLHENFHFAQDLEADPAFASRLTVLLRRDSRKAGLPPVYTRAGGEAHTYLFRVGRAMTSYIPAGHANDEILHYAAGFDGGVGDFDRYVAQTLFFLAGYDTTACDVSCLGLPMVDARDHLVDPPIRSKPAPRRDGKVHAAEDPEAFSAAGRRIRPREPPLLRYVKP